MKTRNKFEPSRKRSNWQAIQESEVRVCSMASTSTSTLAFSTLSQFSPNSTHSNSRRLRTKTVSFPVIKASSLHEGTALFNAAKHTVCIYNPLCFLFSCILKIFTYSAFCYCGFNVESRTRQCRLVQGLFWIVFLLWLVKWLLFLFVLDLVL